jgi:fructose transport system ATP-binding protein
MSDQTAPIVLEARGLVKCYGHVTALDGVDFEVRAGEIMAVIGDNGAGKSSLIKALSGASIPDSGEIWLDGERVHFTCPSDARRAGIETVYQDLALAPAMSIAENVFLGREQRRPGLAGSLLRLLDRARMEREAAEHLQQLGIGIPSITQAVDTLSGGQRQRLALARAFYKKAKVLILDEATSALDNKTESDVLEALELVGRRCTTVVVAHRLSTIRYCDRIFEFERGVIKAAGDYQSLQERSASFRQLVSLQDG